MRASLISILAFLSCALLTACRGPEKGEGRAEERWAAEVVGAAAGADVLLVTVDTLRADSLGFAGHPKVRTPVLDRLAMRGRIFPRAHAQSVVTLPSHASILTGRYPYGHGVRENSGYVLGDDVPTLATILGGAGYTTAAVVGAYPLDSRFGLDRGFDLYDDQYAKGSRPDQFRFAERRGDEVVSRALEWWQQQEGQPRFLWVHLYDPHAPYDPPAAEAAAYPERPYLGEVAATDRFLAPLIDPLLEEGARPTLVVFTSDHGEALGDHGEVTHGLFAYESTLKVPLVLFGPGIPQGSDDRLAGHVDILPTVLDLLGLESGSEASPGRSLLAPDDEERSLYFESLSTYLNRGWAPLRGLLSGTWKMISLPIPELYDLGEDPRESKNLQAVEKSVLGRLHARLPRDDWPPGARQVAPEEAAHLRQLGYLTSSGGQGKVRFEEADDPKTLIGLDRQLHHFIDAYSRGEVAAAVDLGRKIVAERPEMAMGYEHLALALRELGRGEEAAAALQGALDRGVTGDSLRRQLGLTLAEIGQPHRAVEILMPLAASADPSVLNALGVALTDAGRHREAIGYLERALAIDPESAKVLESLGVAHLRMRDPAEAKIQLERALELNQELPIAWNVLGVARSFQGDPKGAIEAWKRAVELDPNLLDALYNLGLTAAQTGDAATARQALGSFLRRVPSGPDAERAREILRGLG